MSSYFNVLLKIRNISSHDGRPLWKYNLSEEEYKVLKKHLSEISTYNYYDPRDFALYFSEWWNKEYEGGAPSIEEVYKSAYGNYGSNGFPINDFYKAAKKGATILGINWIQRENTHYFRTLLLQGGLPIKHLLHHSSNYTRFLKKVLALNPTSISEFANEYDVIRELPYLSRNDAIFESCLQIIQAVWRGDEEYLAIFENQSSATKYISDELRKYKTELNVRRRSKFRAYWILHKDRDETKIRLEFNFPELVYLDYFKELLAISDSELSSEFRLFINDYLVYKFKKTINGNYKIFELNNPNIAWDGEESKPDIYLSSTEGKKFDFPIIFVPYPKTSEPTLWAQKRENEWILCKGKHCVSEKGAVLFHNEWQVTNEKIYEPIAVNGLGLNFYEFEGELQLISEQETIDFKTNSNSFDWSIRENKPDWVFKSNMPIVTQRPDIKAYNKEGEQIGNIQLKWRINGSIYWNEWSNYNIPEGCIEFKIIANGEEENDYFYNIGEIEVEYISDSPIAASIIVKETNLQFRLKKEDSLDINTNNSITVVKLKNNDFMPRTVKAKLIKEDQNRSLQIEIVPPFRGVRIADSSGIVIKNSTELLFGCFMGYRILTPLRGEGYYIKFYNCFRREISIYRKLPSSIVPLQSYEEIALSLSKLTGFIDKRSQVVLELYDSDQNLLSYYSIKSYNKSLSYLGNSAVLTDAEDQCDINLFAIPLDCSPERIEIIPLNNENGSFVFPDNNFLIKHFIIASDFVKNNNRLLPSFFSTEEENIPTTIIDKENRIAKYAENLLSSAWNDEPWIKVKKYFDLCMQFNLPFSILDIFNSFSCSPELAAKLFCFLNTYYPDDEFIYNTTSKFEDDLGFCFHWISTHHWGNAVNWICESLDIEQKTDAYSELSNNIRKLISNTKPMEYFEKIGEYVLTRDLKSLPQLNHFHLKSKIRELRERLGERVLNELPNSGFPKISDEDKIIIPVNADNYRVKLLLKSPLSVALSISGRDEGLWKEDDTVRRNVQYSHWLDIYWHGEAITHSLMKLKN